MAEPTKLLSASGRELPQKWFTVIAIIWIGQAISIVTSYAAGYAAIWYITVETNSALWLAVAAICAYLPQGLLSPFGGVIADKFNRRSIMIIADALIGIVSLVLGIVILMGQASIGFILFMIIARSVGTAFHGPAMLAAMPMLVPEKHLLRINTLDQLIWSVAGIGAPVFGIFLYEVLGFHSVMFLDFAGAIFAVIGLLLVKIPTTHDLAADDKNIFANLADGWRALGKRKGLITLIFGVGIGMVIFSPLGALFPLMVADFFNGDGYMASLTEAAFGIGMAGGSIVLLAWGGGKKLVRLISASVFFVGIVTAACGLLTTDMFIVFVVLCALMGIAFAGFNGPFITVIQKNVPEEKLGRALGLITTMGGLTSPIGIGLGGLLADKIGIAPFFLVDGILFAILAAVVFGIKRVRDLDKDTKEEAAA